MKKLLYSIGLIVAVAVSSCDYIDTPIPPKTGPDTTASSVVKRKVLVEDYTGHTCGNCPKAAKELESLKGVYGDKIVEIAVHAGFFAVKKPAPYDYNFNTAAGTAYDNFFGISKAGNPNGMVNRIDYSTGQHIKGYNNWGTIIAGMVNTDAAASIKITNTYNSTTGVVDIVVDAKVLSDLTGDYMLQVLVTEDSIVKPQKDYSLTPDDNNLTYIHRHALRADVNGSWGEKVITGNAVTGATISKTLNKTLDATWDASHCSIVAFLYNATTYEVIQVEEKKVK